MSIHRAASTNAVDNKINDWAFHLDGVFHNVSQEQIFDSVAKEVVDRTLDGYNGWLIAVIISLFLIINIFVFE